MNYILNNIKKWIYDNSLVLYTRKNLELDKRERINIYKRLLFCKTEHCIKDIYDEISKIENKNNKEYIDNIKKNLKYIRDSFL